MNSSKTKPIEEIIIPRRLAEFIVKHVDKEAFIRWTDKLKCVNDITPKGIIVKLNGDTEEANTIKRDLIFEVLKRTENAIIGPEMAIKEIEVNVKFLVIIRIYIMNQKCGYVCGKKGATLKKIQTDCELDQAGFDNDKYESIPEGFARLTLKGSKVEGLRSARAEIQYLIDTALDINPFGPAIGRKATTAIVNGLSNNENGSILYRETIKFPLYRTFNEEQKKRFRDIPQTIGISYRVDTNEKPENGRFIILEGELDKVLSAKERFAELISEVQQQNSGIKIDKKLLSSRECLELLVPKNVVQEVIGPNGENIKKLKQQLNVGLCFKGNNSEEYPNGRTLLIFGYSMENAQKAKDYIEREFINNSMRIRPTFNDLPLRSNEVQMEITVPELVARKMLKVKINSGISSFERKPASNSDDGCCQKMVVLRGSQDAVEKASHILDTLTTAFSDGNPKWYSVVDLDDSLENNNFKQFNGKFGDNGPVSPFSSSNEDFQENNDKRDNSNCQNQHISDDIDDKELEQALVLTGLNSSNGKDDNNRSESPEIILNENNNDKHAPSESNHDCGMDIDEAFRQAMEMEAVTNDEMGEWESEQTDGDTEKNDEHCKPAETCLKNEEFEKQLMAKIEEEENRFNERIMAYIQEEERQKTMRIMEWVKEHIKANPTVSTGVPVRHSNKGNNIFKQQLKVAFDRELMGPDYGGNDAANKNAKYDHNNGW